VAYYNILEDEQTFNAGIRTYSFCDWSLANQLFLSWRRGNYVYLHGTHRVYFYVYSVALANSMFTLRDPLTVPT
jgi:hypothetical protein